MLASIGAGDAPFSCLQGSCFAFSRFLLKGFSRILPHQA
ncbi:hypothetical protein Chls_452 [Chlamydia suis]|uniref:Uncharacterized protein n=1 Tax=Chlamydia suis TaxID=83559 RepID=A0ABX6ITU9_9CHLA|nr:hypothetical protein Chls_452 [Chlamydia suis]